MKYELTNETVTVNGKTLYRVKALKDFNNVFKGDFGGFIESENNLSQSGNAWVSGNAMVFDNARVYGNAWVFGDAMVYGDAGVYGDAKVFGDARVSQYQKINNCICTCDLSQNLEESIRCQTGLGVFNDKIVAYKIVDKNMCSFQDNNFKYELGKIAEEENPDMSDKSCASGLHFSNMNYWDSKNGIFLQAEIDIKDVITVQEGKIRCKKALITGAYER